MIVASILKGFAWGFLILGTAFSIGFPLELTGKFNVLYTLGGFISSLFLWAVVSGYAIIVEGSVKSNSK
jgi:hypothetical protein